MTPERGYGILLIVLQAGALGLARVIQSLAFRTNPVEPIVLGGAVLFMTAVAALAAYAPAHRATSIDPRTALQ